jgi:hypothetical protein
MAFPTYVQNNEGDTIEIDTPDDISDATVKTFRFKKPDGTIVDVTAAFSNAPGTDGKLKVVTAAGGFLLNQAGPWRVRGYVERPSGKFRTLPAEFYVAADLAASA